MSNSWYLEVTNKNFCALTLSCGLSFSVITRRSRDCTAMHWWGALFIPGSGPDAITAFQLSEYKGNYSSPFHCVRSHRGTLWFNNRTFSQEQTIQSLAHKATWVRVLSNLLGIFVCLVVVFRGWIFKGVPCNNFSTAPHQVRRTTSKSLPFSPFLLLKELGNCQFKHLISQLLFCRFLTCQWANYETTLWQNRDQSGSQFPANQHVISHSAIPSSSLIKRTIHKDRKIYNILKWIHHSQCWSASLRSFRLLHHQQKGKPRGQAPMQSHDTWLQKHGFWPSQIHVPGPQNHWLSHGHSDGKMPVMTGKGLCTQGGYEKKLASNSPFKLRDYQNAVDGTGVFTQQTSTSI